jgi:hypothetical protein
MTAFGATAGSASCFTIGEEGSRRDASAAQVYGVRSDVDFVSASVGAGEYIIHRFTLELPDGHFVDWGTYKGENLDGCPDNASGWKSFAIVTDPYTCADSSTWPEFSGGDTNIPFKVSWGSCPYFGYDVWRFYSNGTRRACLPMDFGQGTASLQAVALDPAATRKVDIHFDVVDRMKSDGSWASWSGGTSCADTGYRVRVIANDNIWLEKVP